MSTEERSKGKISGFTHLRGKTQRSFHSQKEVYTGRRVYYNKRVVPQDSNYNFIIHARVGGNVLVSIYVRSSAPFQYEATSAIKK